MADWAGLIESQRDSLPLPDLVPGVEQSELAQSYFRYYGIDFENRYTGLEHGFGAFTSGDYEIAAHVFRLPDAGATAFVYHGYYDHVGLFNHLIDFLLGRGYSVVAYDLPGHGLSSGERASIDSFDTYVRVLGDAFAAVNAFDLPERKVAVAQSTGCAVLMTHLLTGGENDFEKVVLLAPLVRPAGWWWGRHAHGVIASWVESLPRKWQKNSMDVDFLAWLKNDDRLQHDRLPMSWVGALKAWERRFHALGQSEFRVLVVQGEQDRTVDWRFNLPAIRKHFPGAQLFMLEEAHHHLVKEAEPIRHQIWMRVAQYLGE